MSPWRRGPTRHHHRHQPPSTTHHNTSTPPHHPQRVSQQVLKHNTTWHKERRTEAATSTQLRKNEGTVEKVVTDVVNAASTVGRHQQEGRRRHQKEVVWCASACTVCTEDYLSLWCGTPLRTTTRTLEFLESVVRTSCTPSAWCVLRRRRHTTCLRDRQNFPMNRKPWWVAQNGSDAAACFHLSPTLRFSEHGASFRAQPFFV